MGPSTPPGAENAEEAFARVFNQTFLHQLLTSDSDNESYHLPADEDPAFLPDDDSAGFVGFPEHAEELLQATQFWVQRVLIPCVVIIGVFGNAATIVVLTRRRMQNSTTNIYLTALAVSDLSYLVCVFVLSIAHYPKMKEEPHYAYWQVYIYTLLLTDTSSNTSVWLTVCFTLERYVAVCHPIIGKIICTESRAKRIILAIFVVSFLSALPTPFEWRVAIRTGANNETVVTLDYSEFGRNETFRSIFYWYLALVFVLVPLVTLAIFNSLLVYSLRTSSARRDHLVNNYRGVNYHRSLRHAQEKRITVMLISVVVLFLICQTPTAVTLIYTHFCDPEPFTWAWVRLRILGNVFNLLMTINCASNFVLYCALSLKYRRTFQHVFLPWTTGFRLWSRRSQSRSGSPSMMVQRNGDLDFSGFSRRGVLNGALSIACPSRSDGPEPSIPLQERTGITFCRQSPPQSNCSPAIPCCASTNSLSSTHVQRSHHWQANGVCHGRGHNYHHTRATSFTSVNNNHTRKFRSGCGSGNSRDLSSSQESQSISSYKRATRHNHCTRFIDGSYGVSVDANR